MPEGVNSKMARLQGRTRVEHLRLWLWCYYKGNRKANRQQRPAARDAVINLVRAAPLAWFVTGERPLDVSSIVYARVWHLLTEGQFLVLLNARGCAQMEARDFRAGDRIVDGIRFDGRIYTSVFPIDCTGTNRFLGR